MLEGKNGYSQGSGEQNSQEREHWGEEGGELPCVVISSFHALTGALTR